MVESRDGQRSSSGLNIVDTHYIYTALGSDGQGPQGFSFVFLDLFIFLDLFADLARACLGFLERPSRSCEFVRVGMVRTIVDTLRGPVRP